jgi:cell volume regulation protein A
VDVGPLTFWIGALLAAGIFASLLAGRLRLPGLVLVLVLGMAIGSDGTGWIDFGDFDVAQSAAVVLHQMQIVLVWTRVFTVFVD